MADPFLTLSHGHPLGTVATADTSWNIVASSSSLSPLIFGNGSAATGIPLTMGQESSVGSNSINFSQPIANIALAGSGASVTGQPSMLSPGSIYGDDDAGTAAGRDGLFGAGGSAIDYVAVNVPASAAESVFLANSPVKADPALRKSGDCVRFQVFSRI